MTDLKKTATGTADYGWCSNCHQEVIRPPANIALWPDPKSPYGFQYSKGKWLHNRCTSAYITALEASTTAEAPKEVGLMTSVLRTSEPKVAQKGEVAER